MVVKRVRCVVNCTLSLAITLLVAAQCAETGLSVVGCNRNLRSRQELLQRSASRHLLQQQATGFRTAEDLFSTTEPCTALQNILTTTPAPNSGLGNFTQEPTEEMILSCSSESVFLLDGQELAVAFRAPTPLVKIITMDSPSPIVWPTSSSTNVFPKGSVIVLDCGNQLLDLRNLPVDPFPAQGTLVMYRCITLFTDARSSVVGTMFTFDSQSGHPCNGTSELSQAADFPRSNPYVFERLTAPTAPGITLHVVNVSVWCYTATDVEDLYRENDFLGETADESTRSVPTWAVWVISAGGAFLVCSLVSSAILWCYCGRPCCSYCPHQSRKGGDAKQHICTCFPPHFRHKEATTIERTQTAEEELVSALDTVLQTFRYRSSLHSTGNAASSTAADTGGSDTSQYHDPQYQLSHVRDRGSGSLVGIQSAASDKASLGSSSSAQAVFQQQHNQLEGSQHMHGVHACTWLQALGSTKHAPNSASPAPQKMDLWVEDSYEARSAVDLGMRVGQSRHMHGAEMGDGSVDGRESGKSSLTARPSSISMKTFLFQGTQE